MKGEDDDDDEKKRDMIQVKRKYSIEKKTTEVAVGRKLMGSGPAALMRLCRKRLGRFFLEVSVVIRNFGFGKSLAGVLGTYFT